MHKIRTVIAAAALSALAAQWAFASQESLDEIKKSAENGDSNSQLAMGIFFSKGEMGLPQDGQKAVEWLSKSAEQKNVKAATYLGYLYGEGKLVKRDFEKAVKWREFAASNGSVTDKWSLGNAFLYGFMLPKDQIKALYWIGEAANGGDGNAILKLIEIYHNMGNADAEKHWKEKFASMELKAATAGNVEAMAAVADKYMSGDNGLPLNRAEGIYWLVSAADKGHFGATEKLAQMYAKGRYVSQNPKKAQKYFEKLAEQDPSYCFKISALYGEGKDGFPLDEAKSFEWLERGAKSSDNSTKLYVAWRYWLGNGKSSNIPQALHWLDQIEKNASPDSPDLRAARKIKAMISSGEPAPPEYSGLQKFFR